MLRAMAAYGASDDEQEIQSYLPPRRRASIPTPDPVEADDTENAPDVTVAPLRIPPPAAPPAPLGGFAKAQNAARSGDPAGQQALDQQAQAEDVAARQQEVYQRQLDRDQQVEARKQQREQEKAAEATRARNVRAGAAEGQVTQTDVETGKRVIATHPDGAPVYKAGPQGPPQPVGEVATALPDPVTGKPKAIPDYGIMLGGDGAASATGVPVRKTVFQQPVRDDRGNTEWVNPDPKTDKESGVQYVTQPNPVTGREDKVALGVDDAARQQIQQNAQLEAAQAAHNIRSTQVQQAQTLFQPKWEPVKKEFEDAQRDLERIGKAGVQRRGAAWVRINPETGTESLMSPDAVAIHQKAAGEAQARFNRAKAAYDPMAPQADNFTRLNQDLKIERLKIAEQKAKWKYGLADDDQTLTSILAREDQVKEGQATPPDFESAADPNVPLQPTADQDVALVQGVAEASKAASPALPGGPADPGQPETAKPDAAPAVPLVDAVAAASVGKTPEESQQFARNTLAGLNGADAITVNPTPQLDGGYQLMAGGNSVGFVDRDESGAWIEVNSALPDYDKLANLGTKQGVPLYLGAGTTARKKPTQAAAWAQQVMTALQPDANPDGTPGQPLTDGQFHARLTALGADYPQLMHAAAVGDIPIQIAQSLTQAIFKGGTLKPTDPEAPETFAKWLAETSSKQNSDNVARFGRPADETVGSRWSNTSNIADRNAVRREFLGDWYAENRGKPGVTRAKVQALMAQDVGDKEGTGTKVWSAVKAGGRTLRDDVAGSMGGMFLGAVRDAASAEMVLFGSGEAYNQISEDMALRGRDTANWTNAASRNIKAWNTDAGRKAHADLDFQFSQFQQTLDEEYDKPVPNTGAIAAAEKKVRLAALAMHNLSPDESWPVTEDTLDPDKDQALKSALANYHITADPAQMALYKERLLMNNGRRQFSAEMEQKTRGKGRFQQALIGGMNVGWQEVGSELVGDALAMVSAGGSKAIQLGLEAAGHAGTATRIARLGARMKGAFEALESIGTVEGTLANPLTKGQRIRNAVVGGIRTAAITGAEEGIEEVITEPGSDQPDFLSAFAGGALGGVGLAPAFHVLGHGMGKLGERLEARRLDGENAKFARNWNATMADTPGFQPITHEQAGAARAFVNSKQFTKAAEDYAAAKAEFDAAHAELTGSPVADPAVATKLERVRDRLGKIREQMSAEGTSEERMTALKPHEEALAAEEAQLAAQMPDEGAQEATLNRVMKARQQMDDAYGQFSDQTVGAVDAVNEIAALKDPARQTYYSGLAKVASGNESLLTNNERQAIAGAKTKAGAAIFTDIEATDEKGHPVTRSVITDQGRAELRSDMPALGKLVRTTESDALFEQQLGGAPAPVAESTATPAPEVQQATVGAPDAAAPAAQPSAPNPAEMDSAEYAGYQAATPGAPSLHEVVKQAIAEQRPVSVSMAKAAGIDAPDGYSLRGTTYVHQSGPVLNTSGEIAGDVSQNATDSNTSAPPTDHSPGRESARQVAQSVQARVEQAMPALRGRIETVDQPDGGESGGVIANTAGKIQFVLSDIERELRTHGDAAAVADSLERFIVRHEMVHLVQFDALRALWKEAGSPGSFGQFFGQWYGKLATELSPQAMETARQIYGPDAWDAISNDGHRAAELVRMLVEAKLDPDQADQMSELFRAVRTGSSPSLIELLRSAVKVLTDLIKTGKLPKSVQEHVAKLTELYEELQGKEDGNDSAPSGSEAAATSDAPVSEDLLHSPMRVTGDAIRAAAENNPALTPKLRRQLEFAVEGLYDYLETLPAVQRRGVMDDAIAEWLDGLGKPKQARQIDAPAKTQAHRILNSGEYPALSALFQSGDKIAPRPNLISLILSRKKDGARLTTREISILENNPEYDDAVYRNHFDNAGRGKVAREMLGLLMAKQGEGVRPDVMAGRLGDGRTAADLWRQVDAELRSYVNGSKTGEAKLDPNREWTPEEITAHEAKGAVDSPVEERQADAFESANVPQNGEEFAVEDFSPDMEGTVVTVDGEPMTVTKVEMDSLGTAAETVVLDDHKRFGRQVLAGGDVVYIEHAADEALAASPSPRQRSLDFGTSGDLGDRRQIGLDLSGKVEAAASETNTEPTPAQAEAGNYRKGKVTVHGLTVSIENPRESVRSGTDKSGKAWEVEMAHHYGYILGTVGKDGDHVDAFVGPNPESTKAWVVNQIDPETRRFDEHKVMLGFDSRQDAIAGYKANYSPGWNGIGDVVETDVSSLKTWLENGETKRPARLADFNSAAAAAKTPAKPAGIQDFGDKIGGARKDVWRSYQETLAKDLPDVADISLAKHFPEPDYEAALAQGVPLESLAAFKAVRDSMPSKPRNSAKLKRWGVMAAEVHDLFQKLLTGGAGIEALPDRSLGGDYRMSDLRSKARLYADLGYPLFTKAGDWSIKDGRASVWNGVRYDRSQSVTYAEHKGRTMWKMSVVGEDAQARPKIVDMIRQHLEAEANTPKERGAKAMDFDIYRDRFSQDLFIGKKAVNGVVRLKTGFEDAKSARQYIADNQAALEDQWNGLKVHPEYRRAINEPRQGPLRRPGDVTPEQFQDAFGFRGVQFGNWVEGDRRQVDLNEAFDAFMDLADALGLPPKAMSLDGSLGLAFGARGTGGVMAAAAHYEPGRVVINLTKKSGPGSLAHEFFHAFDNYFARLDSTGETTAVSHDRYATSIKDRPKNVRYEIWDAFRRIRQSIDTGSFADRSTKLDDARSKPYYGTTIEKAARAFERYVVDRLATREIANDYLVNLIKDESPALPTAQEMDGGIRQAYDNLFEILDTKETERGIALHSPASPESGGRSQPVDLPPAVIGHELGAMSSHPDYAAAKAGDREAGLRLARDLVTPEFVDSVRQLVGDSKPVVFPVLAVEQTGSNMIPMMAAEALAHKLGLDTETGVVQSVKANRTGKGALDRVFSPPGFDGLVEPGKSYLLLDDTLTQGGTFAALADHIRQSGGTVVGAVALTGKQYSANLRLSDESLAQLREQHGAVEDDFRRATGHGFDRLTESEARALAKFRPLTPSEAESLRNEMREASEWAKKELAKNP